MCGGCEFKKKNQLFSFFFIPEGVKATLYRTQYRCVEYCEVFWERRKEQLSYDCRKQMFTLCTERHR